MQIRRASSPLDRTPVVRQLPKSLLASRQFTGIMSTGDISVPCRPQRAVSRVSASDLLRTCQRRSPSSSAEVANRAERTWALIASGEAHNQKEALRVATTQGFGVSAKQLIEWRNAHGHGAPVHETESKIIEFEYNGMAISYTRDLKPLEGAESSQQSNARHQRNHRRKLSALRRAAGQPELPFDFDAVDTGGADENSQDEEIGRLLALSEQAST